MELTFEIKPKEGFGNLKFGTVMEKVIAQFGKPEEVDNFAIDDDINAVLLHYWEKGFSVFFQGLTLQIVSGFETDHPNTSLYGSKIIGMEEDDVIKLMKEHGFVEYEKEIDEKDGEVRLSYEEEMVDFYIKDNKVAFVNWDILVDDDGNIFQ